MKQAQRTLAPPASAALAWLTSNWQSVHAGLFLGLFVLSHRLPWCLDWPLHLLLPFLVYYALVGLIAALRRTSCRFSAGRCDRFALAATAMVVALASLTLLVYQFIVQPDLTELAAHLPTTLFGSVVAAGVYFSVVNALLEEALFRGLLYDALESQWGWRTAILGSAVIFGAGHVVGYPQGLLGAVLAGIYGLILGWLRRETRGLAAPVVAHIFADATIFWILAQQGV